MILADIVFQHALLQYQNLYSLEELDHFKIFIQIGSESISTVGVIILFFYISKHIIKQQSKSDFELKILINNKKNDSSIHKQILDNLQEGVLITSQEGVTYVNQVFKTLIGERSFDQKLFKIHDRQESSSEYFSINELLDHSQFYFKDKVFEIELGEKKYVQIKIKNFRSKQTLLQIIDMSQ